MQVDSAVALGRDDPALELPWSSEDGSFSYCDLKSDPALIDRIAEADNFPELREFLLRMNKPDFMLETAKSDVWFSGEMLPEEEIFSAQRKLVSYVDFVFAADEPRLSLLAHQKLVERISSLLQKAPEMPASVELVIRHCHFHNQNAANSSPGFCITVYVSGFGADDDEARKKWAVALKLLQHALVQAGAAMDWKAETGIASPDGKKGLSQQ